MSILLSRSVEAVTIEGDTPTSTTTHPNKRKNKKKQRANNNNNNNNNIEREREGGGGRRRSSRKHRKCDETRCKLDAMQQRDGCQITNNQGIRSSPPEGNPPRNRSGMEEKWSFQTWFQRLHSKTEESVKES